MYFQWNAFGFVGKDPDDSYLDSMMNEAPGPINFTMFLTLFGERLQGTDPEEVIRNAFACFDEDNTGQINEEKLRELLTTMGDRFTDEEVSYLNCDIRFFLCNYWLYFTCVSNCVFVKTMWITLTEFVLKFRPQVDEMFREAPIDKFGNFNYIEFTRILKHGAKDKDEQ